MYPVYRVQNLKRTKKNLFRICTGYRAPTAVARSPSADRDLLGFSLNSVRV
jgi:hypothetical protein